MAELKLTDEEKAAISWLDISDDALGKLVRKNCLALPKMCEKNEADKVWITTAAMLMCNLAAEANSAKTTFKFDGLTLADKQQGNWKVVITRTKSPNAELCHRSEPVAASKNTTG